MKVIYNKYFPFKPFYAINMLCIVFVRKDVGYLSQYDINHEAIHSAQMKELLFLLFYFLYVAEWIWGLFKYRDTLKAYMNISFEREAYHNQSNLYYLQQRPMWSSFKYLKEE